MTTASQIGALVFLACLGLFPIFMLLRAIRSDDDGP